MYHLYAGRSTGENQRAMELRCAPDANEEGLRVLMDVLDSDASRPTAASQHVW
jgi:hypothetical protein